MPPPNHQIGSSPEPSTGWATKNRTFRCTVGMYGLRGCRTSETPIASQCRPTNCGRAAVAEGGRRVPDTFENPMPPRSSRAPPSRMQVSPPPPVSAGFSTGSDCFDCSDLATLSRCHWSSRKRLPSSASRALTIWRCSPTSQVRTAEESTVPVSTAPALTTPLEVEWVWSFIARVPGIRYLDAFAGRRNRGARWRRRPVRVLRERNRPVRSRT